jgi:hypothetical protein
MKIYYREKSGGIEILRCFGIEGRVEIPGMIDGKLVISAAPYAFSSHMDEKEDLKNASLWEVSDGLEKSMFWQEMTWRRLFFLTL